MITFICTCCILTNNTEHAECYHQMSFKYIFSHVEYYNMHICHQCVKLCSIALAVFYKTELNKGEMCYKDEQIQSSV